MYNNRLGPKAYRPETDKTHVHPQLSKTTGSRVSQLQQSPAGQNQSHLIVVVYYDQVPQAQSPEQLEHSRKRCLLQGNQMPLAHFTYCGKTQTPQPSISRVLSRPSPPCLTLRPCGPLIGFSEAHYHLTPNFSQAVPNSLWSDDPSQDASPTCAILEGLLCLQQSLQSPEVPYTFSKDTRHQPYPSPASKSFGSISTCGTV